MKWNESPVSKARHSQYAGEMYGTWDIVWDQSHSNLVEFIARRNNDVVYVHYQSGLLDKLSEGQRRREVAWHIDFFDNAMDFRSFLESRNDGRLKKIVV